MANNNYQAQVAQAKQAGLGVNLASMKNQTLQGSILGGSNTINLGNLVLGAQGSSFNLFDDHIKKYEVLESNYDVLLLSVTLHRLKNEKSTKPIEYPRNITDKSLIDFITEVDKVRTDELRDYYSKKFLWWTLNEIRLSNFRTDLKNLIHSDGKIFKENILPLAYRMPEFYEYDLSFDELMLKHNTIIKDTKRTQVCSKKLKHVCTLNKRRKFAWYIEYWFADENDNLNVITINKDNPLKSLLNFVIKNPITIEGIIVNKTRDNKQYNVVEKYTFL